jgi:DNA-binding transcriptional ArsR family regulator
MAQNKKELFNENQQKLAAWAKLLAHPARIAILEVLAKKNTCFCGDIVDELPLAQATVSQHLKELKDAGLIKGEIDGLKTCYCINDSAFTEFKALLNQFLQNINDLKNNCC